MVGVLQEGHSERYLVSKELRNILAITSDNADVIVSEFSCL